jgi:hypothetical protein
MLVTRYEIFIERLPFGLDQTARRLCPPRIAQALCVGQAREGGRYFTRWSAAVTLCQCREQAQFDVYRDLVVAEPDLIPQLGD